MARSKHDTRGRRATIVLACLLLLVTTTIQAVHSCETVAAPQTQIQGTGIAAAHDGVCRLCASPGLASLFTPIVHGIPVLTAIAAERSSIETIARQAQSYALQVRPPPFS